MGPGRSILTCKQKAHFVGRWRFVGLEQSCGNFYPSSIFRAGAKAERRIALTRGKFAIVDAEDYYQLSKFNWYAKPDGKTIYAGRTDDRKAIIMHRVIMGAPDHLSVDHIDHNGLNNRRSNLRLCTKAQNSRNVFSYKGSTSKYKGVCWYKKGGKWSAKIKLNNKTYHLGHFEDEIAAAKAYDKKAVELHGEFACLNFPPEAESSEIFNS